MKINSKEYIELLKSLSRVIKLTSEANVETISAHLGEDMEEKILFNKELEKIHRKLKLILER